MNPNRIYFNLDGVSEFNGEMKSNRIIFATILMEYCLFSDNRPKAGAPTFRIGNEYKVNTEVFGLAGDLLGFGKSDEKTFFLKQQKEITKRVFIVPKEGDPNATERVTEDLDEGAEFYPLDMVYFIEQHTSETNEGGEQQGTIMMVPAIYVKALADAEKWEDINETIRIVADMVGVVFGIGTLALSGNPYLLLAAAADLSLALPDLTIQAFRAEIAKLPGGDEFLRQWDLIYNVLGSAVAAPQLTVAFYRSCLGLLRTSVNVAENVKQGLRASAISVFLDLNSGVYQRKDLRMFSPTEWVIPSAGFISKTSECDALIQNGAFFMELDAAAIMESIGKKGGINPDAIGSISSSRRFALVYKGEIIAQGSRYDKAYQNVLQEIRKVSYSSEKVGKILNEIVKQIRINTIIEEDGWVVIRGLERENVAKAWLGDDGEFNISIITKNTSLENNGRRIFKNLFTFINVEYDEISKIRGTWRPSVKVGDNLNTFNELIKKGMSQEDASKGTFTGKMAGELGFNVVRLESTSIKNTEGVYVSVDVIFLKK
ncbi:hypothetical protein J2786_003011 [Chryseobacterium vietnamense]|uniref:Uncharacterized protein n=1 Tax=Chryseobacterium vietnamense TaxID=866785 RepID=A0ACC6JAE7_9FLAO|nr:hypothetical protein [Chryseobacterium vietnamense]MDR6459888.1 hypothetical protein [Chryseobacterium vietnamense]